MPWPSSASTCGFALAVLESGLFSQQLEASHCQEESATAFWPCPACLLPCGLSTRVALDPALQPGHTLAGGNAYSVPFLPCCIAACWWCHVCHSESLLPKPWQSDMSCKLFASLPCSLDTGRLNAETYQIFDAVEKHYGIRIEYTFPDAQETMDLVRAKGMYSFYEDGHQECCRVRKVRLLVMAASVLCGRN